MRKQTFSIFIKNLNLNVTTINRKEFITLHAKKREMGECLADDNKERNLRKFL